MLGYAASYCVQDQWLSLDGRLFNVDCQSVTGLLMCNWDDMLIYIVILVI